MQPAPDRQQVVYVNKGGKLSEHGTIYRKLFGWIYLKKNKERNKENK
jgi:hypothetical protein